MYIIVVFFFVLEHISIEQTRECFL